MEATVFAALPPLMPTKAQKVSKYTEKNSGGPNRRAKPATTGDRNVIMITAIRAPMKEEVNAAVSALPARPCRASGWPAKVVATDQGSPGILTRIDVIAPPTGGPRYTRE